MEIKTAMHHIMLKLIYCTSVSNELLTKKLITLVPSFPIMKY